MPYGHMSDRNMLALEEKSRGYIHNFLFDLEDRPLMPLYCMPLLGSWLADVCGYNRVVVLFAVALLSAWFTTHSRGLCHSMPSCLSEQNYKLPYSLIYLTLKIPASYINR